jgi:LmbE family N-acetylglucosaminyl deacetylase
MNDFYNNSFYNQKYSGVKVLVLVPHEDDEINLAGSMIVNFINLGAEVYVCFSTNGDYKISAKVRLKEAINALTVLGCKKENTFFMGYGDTLNSSVWGHIFYTENKPIKSPSGHCETYGDADIEDYAWKKRRKHSPYTRNSYVLDLKDVILDIYADVVICVDFDSHADHRMLSVVFDKVIGEILARPDNVYMPQIFKGFAYSTAYFAVNDFYSDNIVSTQHPFKNTTKNNIADLIDSSNYEWKSRIRFPIHKICISRLLNTNIIAKALKKHRSQHAVLHAESIINGDAVFFERRTDSITYQASIQASSGNAEYLNDFCLINTDDIDNFEFHLKNYLWTPEENDLDKTVVFKWHKPQMVSFIRIYGNIEEDSSVINIRIVFDNGFTLETGVLPAKGTPLDIVIPEQREIKKCTLQILAWSGKNYGIAECELFSSIEQQNFIKPFIKLMIDDNFIYCYECPKTVQKIKLDIFKYHVTGDIKVVIINGDAKISDMIVTFGIADKIVVRAYLLGDETIFDQVTIKRVSGFYQKYIHVLQAVDKFCLYFIGRWHRKLCFFKSNGILATIKSIIKN